MKGKVLKSSILLIYSVFIVNTLFAQSPCWYSKKQKCSHPDFTYCAGIGEDANELRAKNMAEAEACKTFLAEVYGIKMEDATYGEIVENGIDKIKIFSRPLLYEKERTEVQGNKVYVLLLFYKYFPREENRTKIIYPSDLLCDDNLPLSPLTWNDFSRLYKSFSNQYFFNMGSGITYGLCGATFGGRHGSVVGFGYQFGLGFGYDYKLHYSGGIKFYPYNCFFISANYGTVGVGNPGTYQNTDDGKFTFEKNNSIQYGSSFLVGADICFGKKQIREGAGGMINLAIGYSPDTKDVLRRISVHNSIVWNVGIGLVF